MDEDDTAFADAELTGWSKVPVGQRTPAPPEEPIPVQKTANTTTLAPVLLFAGAVAIAGMLMTGLFALWWLS